MTDAFKTKHKLVAMGWWQAEVGKFCITARSKAELKRFAISNGVNFDPKKCKSATVNIIERKPAK